MAKLLSVVSVIIVTFLTLAEARRTYIDLSYAFNNETVLFPGRKSTFNVEVEGYTAAGFW